MLKSLAKSQNHLEVAETAKVIVEAIQVEEMAVNLKVPIIKAQNSKAMLSLETIQNLALIKNLKNKITIRLKKSAQLCADFFLTK